MSERWSGGEGRGEVGPEAHSARSLARTESAPLARTRGGGRPRRRATPPLSASLAVPACLRDRAAAQATFRARRTPEPWVAPESTEHRRKRRRLRT